MNNFARLTLAWAKKRGQCRTLFWGAVLGLLMGLVAGSASAAEALPDNPNPVLKWLGLVDTPQSTISPANAIGREINGLYALQTYLSLIVFVVVTVIFVVTAIKFRQKANAHPKDIHGSMLMEIIWTSVPVLIVLILTVPTLDMIFRAWPQVDLEKNDKVVLEYPDEQDPAKRRQEFNRYLEINVIGHQWWWEFEYQGYHTRNPGEAKPTFTPIQRNTANEPVLPVGIPIKMNFVSEDVIHSFWIPRLSVKMDVMPATIDVRQDASGQIIVEQKGANQKSFLIEKEGYYFGQCAEYCGASHPLMRFNVRAVSQEKFDQWVKWGQGELVVSSEKAKEGQIYFQSCLACHTLDGMKSHVKRSERLQADYPNYVADLATYKTMLKAWEEEKLKENPKLHERDLLNDPSRPTAPTKPNPHSGIYRTIAPDLTDLRFRQKILAGIQDNTRENLKRWIKNPASQKPEIEGTPVVRMPAYESAYSDEVIDSVIEFLMTIQYTGVSEPSFAANH